MTTKSAIIIGVLIVIAAIAHSTIRRGTREPVHVGYVAGDILTREQNGIAHLKCNGFKVECYDSFILVYVDKSKEPTWTDNYVLAIPWNKVEHLALLPKKEVSATTQQ